MRNGRPVGIRPGSEVAIIVDGNACSAAWIPIRQSPNDVYLSEGGGGVIDPRFIIQVVQPRSGRILYTTRGGWLTALGEEEEEESREREERDRIDQKRERDDLPPSSNRRPEAPPNPPKGSSSNESLQWDLRRKPMSIKSDQLANATKG